MSRTTSDTVGQTATFRQGELRLIEVIGSGGFGTVYRAEILGEMGFRKSVAVKVLSEAGQTDAEIVSRLRDEARILGLLSHRAIVGVDDLLRVDGRWAVVMELVDGEDLSRLMEEGPMPGRVVAEICREAALALSAAHTACHPETGEHLHVIHRDIKPANLKITSAGEVKVLDFGVARARFANREAETRAIRFGSPGYIAPERFDGEDSAAADVYSLGAVLVECLLGARLGRLPMSRSQHPLAVHNALARTGFADTELGEVARAMLAYEPEDRPSAGEVARRLRVAALSSDGPWLSEWAPIALRALRGDTIPKAPPASADTLDLPDAVSSNLEPLPPPTSEEDRNAPGALGPAPRFEPGLQSGAFAAAAEPRPISGPMGGVEPGPPSGPFLGPALGASITFDEPALGSLSVPLGEEGHTTPLAEEEPPAPRGRGGLVAAFLALMLVGGGVAFALRGASGDGASGPEVPVEALPSAPEGVATPEPVQPGVEEPVVEVPEVVAPATPAAPTARPTAPVVAPPPRAPTAPTVVEPVTKVEPQPRVEAPPKVEPAPTVVPEAAPVARGTVVVTGQVDEVALFSSDGQRLRPGRVAPGRYEVAWRFGDGELVRAGVTVDVAEGQVVTLFCGASTGSCRVLH